MMYYWYCQMKKNEWLWKFWKRNDLYENLEKRGDSRERGEEETKFMPRYSIREKVNNSIFIFRAISLTSVGKPPCFLHFWPCLHMAHEIIRLLLCFFSGLHFPPKHSGKNIRSASGFFIAGNPFVKKPGLSFLHFRLILIAHVRISVGTSIFSKKSRRE
jgi:hypothetical protein